jgi:hypothetical protein
MKMADSNEPVVPVTVVRRDPPPDARLPQGIIATTPDHLPDVRVIFIQPIVAIFVRFINTYLTILVGLVTAGLTSNIIPASDFLHLVVKCMSLSIAGAAVGTIKDLVTVFGKLEGKYPLLTGSV